MSLLFRVLGKCFECNAYRTYVEQAIWKSRGKESCCCDAHENILRLTDFSKAATLTGCLIGSLCGNSGGQTLKDSKYMLKCTEKKKIFRRNINSKMWAGIIDMINDGCFVSASLGKYDYHYDCLCVKMWPTETSSPATVSALGRH